jgi:sugar phosphate isomerase/epimerase
MTTLQNGGPTIVLHINYFEQGQSLERACELARKLGADGIEFRRQPSGWAGSNAEYLDALARALDRHPLDWVGFGSVVNLMDQDAAVRDRELDAAESFYREASRRFPVKLVNAFAGILQNPDAGVSRYEGWHHGSAIASEDQWSHAVGGYRRLAGVAEELGFRIAFETHLWYVHDTLESAIRFVDSIGSPNAGITWDQGNLYFLRPCLSTAEVLKKAENRIFHVHLKNLLPDPNHFFGACNLEDGVINVREQAHALGNAGYSGAWCIESPRDGDRERFAVKDIGYMRDVLEDLGCH